MSSNKAGFDLQEIGPLSRNTLPSWEISALADTGQRADLKASYTPTDHRGWGVLPTSPKVSTDNLMYSVDVRDTAKSGIGHRDNRHLNDPVESISVNVGGSQQNVKASSLPMSAESVGGVLVVGAQESGVHGEGHQFVGSPK